jgi:UDP-N-acetylmuramate dehydrogenase
MILRNISLKKYNTFGLDYKADCLISIETENEVVKILQNQHSLKQPLFVLGGGSNILFTKDPKETILHAEIMGIDITEQNTEYIIVSSGAGVIWDDFVKWAVNSGFGGLENLSLVPGLVGATPVQNIGAYGVEAKDYIEKVRAVSLTDGSIREFCTDECRFGYRDSIFKNELKGKYLITKVWFRLSVKPVFNLMYGSLKEETKKFGEVSLNTVRQAVINIRTAKLPDPANTGNAGSFFKNPVLSPSAADMFKQKYPSVPFYSEPSGDIKIAAGWLIDQCGWKGKRLGDAGVHDQQALVLVNCGKAKGEDILRLSEEINKSVYDRFGIGLEREVEVK